MKMPDAILAKTLVRLDSLIADGHTTLSSNEDIPPSPEQVAA